MTVPGRISVQAYEQAQDSQRQVGKGIEAKRA